MQCFLSCLGGGGSGGLGSAALRQPGGRSQELPQPSLETPGPVRGSCCRPALPACLSLGLSRVVGVLLEEILAVCPKAQDRQTLDLT